jgi:hypothetical protein
MYPEENKRQQLMGKFIFVNLDKNESSGQHKNSL